MARPANHVRHRWMSYGKHILGKKGAVEERPSHLASQRWSPLIGICYLAIKNLICRESGCPNVGKLAYR